MRQPNETSIELTPAGEVTPPAHHRRYAGERAGHTGRDQRTATAAEATLQGGKSGPLKRLLPFLGPAFIASIAYVDPGNFATNIQGGAQFGYLLLWVIVASNIMAMLIQMLSAKLGIATGKNLPETIRERFPKPLTRALWVQAEFVAMATDLAEFLGAAVALNLLFGIPLFPAGLLTAVATFGILGLQRMGFRPLEAVIAGFVGIIAVCYMLETVLSKPDVGAVGSSILQPRFQGSESVLLATGILGATVMPHVIYLHSALTQGRVVAQDHPQRKRLFRFEMIDILIAMGLAGFINASMLMMAAAAFWAKGYDVTAADDIIFESYRTLTPPARRIGQHNLRDLPARRRAFVLRGGHDGGAGDHARVHRAHDPDVAAPLDHDAAGADRDRPRCRHHAHADHQPGDPLLRDPVCAGAAGDVHPQPRDHG